MSSGVGDAEHEKQPLQQAEGQDDVEPPQEVPPNDSSHDTNLTGQSLIRHTDDTPENDLVSPYHMDPTRVTDAYENPYRETTDTSQNFIRRVPSSDLVPAPFKKFNHVIILSVIATVFFVFIGVFAIRLARNAKTHHIKGLYGLAQRDSKKSVILSYLSLTLGFLTIITILVLTHAI